MGEVCIWGHTSSWATWTGRRPCWKCWMMTAGCTLGIWAAWTAKISSISLAESKVRCTFGAKRARCARGTDRDFWGAQVTRSTGSMGDVRVPGTGDTPGHGDLSYWGQVALDLRTVSWSETAARGQEVPVKVQREWGQPYQQSTGKAGPGEPQPGAILGCTVRVRVLCHHSKHHNQKQLRKERGLFSSQLRPHAIIQGVNAGSRS